MKTFNIVSHSIKAALCLSTAGLAFSSLAAEEDEKIRKNRSNRF